MYLDLHVQSSRRDRTVESTTARNMVIIFLVAGHDNQQRSIIIIQVRHNPISNMGIFVSFLHPAFWVYIGTVHILLLERLGTLYIVLLFRRCIFGISAKCALGSLCSHIVYVVAIALRSRMEGGLWTGAFWVQMYPV